MTGFDRATQHFRWMAVAWATAWLVAAGLSSAPAAIFTDVTAGAGINHLQNVGNAPGAGLFRTGGAAAADYDNDGWVDLFVTRLNARPLLYRNLGNGTFQDVATTSGFTSSLPANGAAWGDIDNDGDKDLYVTSSGGTRFYLYVNDGTGKFTEQAIDRGAAIDGVFRYGQSVTFGDYDGDGYLDIHTNDWGNDISLSTSRLLRNQGATNPGHFQDVTATAGLDVYRPSQFQGGGTDSNAFRYSSTFTDLDRDGHPDLAIAADFLTSQIFWNNGDGTFTDGTLAAGAGTDEDGMGSTFADYDGDGRMDWFVSALVSVPGQTQTHSGNRLFRNNGDRTFTDETDMAGVRNSGWSWGTTFLDYDNDRDQDLFVTNGWDTNIADQSHLFQNNGGVYTDVSNAAGVTDNGMGRGLVSLDFDNDGDLDVFIVNHGAKPILYRNDVGNDNNWLKIRVRGTESNRDGLGAFITVDPDTGVTGDELVREITAGSTYLGHNDLTAHFGFGAAIDAVDSITISWPSGNIQALSNVPTNQNLYLIENALPGDYNHDLVVDAADYTVWRNQFEMIGIGLAADGNGDSKVSDLDYSVWKTNFGVTSINMGRGALSAAVPEPATGRLLLLAAVLAASSGGGRTGRNGPPRQSINRPHP
jgi:enediyne biosynthesis protein E4